jgi:hypothetical protein
MFGALGALGVSEATSLVAEGAASTSSFLGTVADSFGYSTPRQPVSRVRFQANRPTRSRRRLNFNVDQPAEMPKRKQAYPKRFTKRRRTAPKSRSVGFRSLNSRVGGYLGLEKKFVDHEYSSTLVQTVASAEADPAINHLCGITQDDSQNGRDGRHVRLESLHIQGHLKMASYDSATRPDNFYVRLFVVLDTQTNGAQFNAEDVLSAPTDSTLSPDAMRNLQYVGRFKMLKTMTLVPTLNPGDNAGSNHEAAGDALPFEMHIRLKGLDVHHTGTSSAVSNVADNSIHLIAIKSEGTTVTTTLKYVARTRFYG